MRGKTSKNFFSYLFSIMAVVLVIISSQFVFAQEDIVFPELKIPLVITTCGQSPGGLNVFVLCKRIKLPCEKIDILKAEDLKEKKEKGIPCNTLMIIAGSSLKGLGAAGVKIETEVARIEDLIREAKEQGIFIIGAHIEGMARRVDQADEESIKAVVPKSDLLIVRADGNEDAHFTKLAEEHKIPLIIIQDTLEITDLLKKLFNIES